MSGMKIVDSRRFMVQPDWPLSIRLNQNDTVWVGYQEFGRKSEFGTLEFEYNKEKRVTQPRSVFCDANLENGQLYLMKNDAGSVKSCFRSPQSQFKNIHGGKQIHSLDINESGALGISSDASQYDVIVWNASTASIETRLSGHVLDVYKCRFFPSGQVVLTASGDTRLKIWSLPSGQCVRTCQGHKQGVEDVGFVDEGQEIVSVSRDGQCKVWECSTANALLSLTPDSGPLTCLALSDNHGNGDHGSKMVVIGGEAGKGFIYCIKSSEKVATLACSGPVNAALYLDDNCVLLGCEDGFIHLFDSRNPSAALSIRKDDRGAVLCLKQQNKAILASFGDGSVCSVMDVDEKKEFVSLPHVELTGPDCDPVPDIAVGNNRIYTACRDAIVRVYAQF